MQGYKVSFNVFASSQEAADKASMAAREFVDRLAAKGIAVTAEKLASALSRYGNNFIVESYFE